jgi:hypothetical protein
LITGASVSIFPITNIVEGRLGLDTSTNVLYTFVGGSWQTVVYL